MNHSVSTMTGKTKIKIIFLGNQSVGKSSIIQKYVHNRFDEASNSTVGIDFLAKNITYKNRTYRLQLWDTAGQERFRSLIPSYLKDAHCSLIVFDVTSRQSLNSVEMWYKLYQTNCKSDGFTLVVGNKVDLDYREVTQQEGKATADELGLSYYEISAKTGENVEDLFSKLVEITAEKTGEVNFSLEKKQPNNPVKEIQEEKEAEDDENTKAQMGKQQSNGQNISLKTEKQNQKTQPKKKCC